jgi:hypothetical protein
MPDWVVVFLDYQNVYRRARGAFLLESGPAATSGDSESHGSSATLTGP